jgi:hypothetical protein
MSDHQRPLSRTAYWQEQINRWKTSGQSRLAYCKQHRLSYPQFRYWQRKLHDDRLPAHRGFVAVERARRSASSGLVMVLPNGIELRGIDDDNLPLVGRLLRLGL